MWNKPTNEQTKGRRKRGSELAGDERTWKKEERWRKSRCRDLLKLCRLRNLFDCHHPSRERTDGIHTKIYLGNLRHTECGAREKESRYFWFRVEREKLGTTAIEIFIMINCVCLMIGPWWMSSDCGDGRNVGELGYKSLHPAVESTHTATTATPPDQYDSLKLHLVFW